MVDSDNTRGRNVVFDILRLFAIIGVILIHISAEVLLIPYMTNLMKVSIFINIFSKYSVPLFFFISGYVLTRNYSEQVNWLSFFKNRFGKILPGYLIASLLYIYYNISQNQIYDFQRAFLEIISGSAMYHLWFIPVLIQFYLIFPIIIKYCKNNLNLYLIVFWIVDVLYNILILFPSLNVFPIKTITYRIFLRYLLYFYLGIYFNLKESEKKHLNLARFTVQVLIIFICVILTSNIWIEEIITYGGYYNIPSMSFIMIPIIEPIQYCLTILVFVKISDMIRNNSIYYIVTKTSPLVFDVYLIHVFYINIIYAYIISINFEVMNMDFYVVLFVSTLIFSFVSSAIIRKLIYYIGRVRLCGLFTCL